MTTLARNRNNYRSYDGALQKSQYASNYTVIPIIDNRAEENVRKADLENFLRQAGKREPDRILNPITSDTYEPNINLREKKTAVYSKDI